jgi:predicted FMN-binding regulatory protein PaiB
LRVITNNPHRAIVIVTGQAPIARPIPVTMRVAPTETGKIARTIAESNRMTLIASGKVKKNSILA